VVAEEKARSLNAATCTLNGASGKFAENCSVFHRIGDGEAFNVSDDAPLVVVAAEARVKP